jgi:hypothetical protein
MTVTTGSPVHGGYVLARPEGMGVLFVRWALPGEVVSVRLVGRKREYAFAEAVEVLSPSPRRVDPPCEVFGECGGCQLQHADYSYQLEMKREILREAFRRIGKTDVAPETAPAQEPFGYRYRGRFRVDGEKVGFHGERSHRLVPVSRCPLMIDAINAVLPGLRGLGRFGIVSEVQVASDGVRASASFPGVPFGKGMVDYLAGRTGGVLSGARFEDRSWGEEVITRLLPGELADEPGDGAPDRGDPRGVRRSASAGPLCWRRELRASPGGQGPGGRRGRRGGAVVQGVARKRPE